MSGDDRFLLWMFGMLLIGFPAVIFGGIALLHLVGIPVY